MCEAMSVCMSECRYAHECKGKSMFAYMYTCVCARVIVHNLLSTL